MNAYYIQDRLEAQSWARHYQQIACEEKEAELADNMEKGLPQLLKLNIVIKRTGNGFFAGPVALQMIDT